MNVYRSAWNQGAYRWGGLTYADPTTLLDVTGILSYNMQIYVSVYVRVPPVCIDESDTQKKSDFVIIKVLPYIPFLLKGGDGKIPANFPYQSLAVLKSIHDYLQH